MPDLAIKAAKRRQALGIAVFLAAVAGAVSLAYHFFRAGEVAYHRGERAFARGDGAAALAHYERARAAGMAGANLDWRQATLLLDAGRRSEALELLRAMLARDPRDRAAIEAAAGAAQALGDPAAGLALYDGLGPRETLPAADLARLADLHQQAGQVAEAIECLRLAVVAAPASADLRVWLGQLRARAGEKAAARAEFEGALAVEPAHRAARLSLARVLAWEGDFVASAAAYRAYLGEPTPP